MEGHYVILFLYLNEISHVKKAILNKLHVNVYVSLIIIIHIF